MCIKSIYHNTYGDGTHDVTERIEACSSGPICARPRIIEYDREYKLSRHEVKEAKRARHSRGHNLPPSPSFFPPTPRSMSPANAPSPRRSSTLEPPTFASSSSSSRPIPIRRSSTVLMHGMETPPMDRGRRPVVVEDHVPRIVTSSASPVAVEVQEHASSDRLRRRHSLHSRRDSVDGGVYRSSSFSSRQRPALVIDDEDMMEAKEMAAKDSRHRHRDHSPVGYGSAEDSHDREERHRRRRAERERASVMPSSLPVYGNTDVLSSSYESSAISSDASAPASVSTSAYAAVKKELRWEDEQRLKHNARISMRPKLDRSETLKPSPKQPIEVKSILKNGNGNSSTPSAPSTPVEGRSPAVSSLSPRTPQRAPPRTSSRGRRSSMSASPDPRHSSDLEDVFGSFSGLGIHGRSGSPAERLSDGSLDHEYRDRMRSRFNMPLPRRYTAGSGGRRRTEVWYPEERRYRFV